GKEKAVSCIQQHDGVRRMPGSGDHLQYAAIEIDLVAVVQRVGDMKRLGRVGLGIKAGRQFAADFLRSKFGLRVGRGAVSVLTSEVCVHAVDVGEAPVVSNVVVVGVRIDHA